MAEVTQPTNAATSSSLQQANEAATYVKQHYPQTPQVGLILGTGLGHLAESIAEATIIPYTDIPHFPRSTVVGHAGQLVLGKFGGCEVAAFEGRFHLYEGYTPQQVVLPTRMLHQLGTNILIVTNAAGGLAPEQRAGDLLLITDHIGLPMMVGLNPLLGPNDEQLGPRFPAMTGAYDAELRTSARRIAAEAGITLHEGVYVMLSGPNYETPAELRFLRSIGADAVGMSTVPEVIAARHMGMRVLAISCITNLTLPVEGDAPPEPSHGEVVATAAAAGQRLGTIIQGVVQGLADSAL